MKKSFTFLFLLSLLTVLGSLSVKADDLYVRNFGYQDNQWTQSSSEGQTSCAGNISPVDKIITGSDFYFSGRHDDAFKRSDDEWTGVNGANNNYAGVKACTRESKTVSLSAGTYTFKLLSKNTEDVTLTLPKIILGSDEYTVTDIIVDESSQSFSSNQYYYTGGKETTLCYGITLSSAYNGTVSVEFKDGWKEKYLFKTLTISQDAPATPTYDVTVNNDGNGTASADKAKYEAGEMVTLTAEPNANYLFDGWTTSDDGFSFADEHSASTTFTMPAKAVTVQANFVACSGQTVTVNVNNGDMGYATGEGSYCAGSQVNLTATPKSGYRFVNWTVTSGSASLDNVNNASTHFAMSNPAAAVTVQANFEVDPCTNTKTIQCEDYVEYNTKPSGSGDNKPENLKSKDYAGYGNPIGGYYADFDNSTGEMWIPVTLPAGTFTFTVRYVKGGNNMWFNLYDVSNNLKIANSKQLSQKGDSWDSDVSNSYTLTSGDYVIGIFGNDNYTGLDQITITATSNVFCLTDYEISLVNTEGGSAPPTAEVNSSAVTSAESGTTVTVTAAEANSGYYFSGWTASPEVTFANPTSATTTFEMPEADVTITANYGEVVSSALTFSAVEGGSITSATAGGNDISSGGAVVSGTSVTLTAEANSNYVFINWTDNNNSDAVVSTNAAFTFSMPATATSYTANFAQVDNVIVTGGVTTISDVEYGGDATMVVTSVPDFDAFNHNVLKFAYSDMDGKYKGQRVAIDAGYSYSASAQATGFGFYYKTEKADDDVAFCFDTRNGQVKWELQATNNVWKYYYFAHAEAASWNHGGIIIYMNGDDDGANTHTTYKDGGAFYMSEIAATSITSKPDIDSYTYTRDITSNSYGTLCLPMEGTVTGATLYSVAGKQEEGGKLYIVLEEQGDTLEAGEPYIFETDGSPLTATMSGPHSAVIADANGLVGTYTEITAPAYSESDNLNYILAPDNSGNTVFKKVGSGVTVGAYRAYINIKNADNYSPASAAPGRKYIRFGIEGTEEEQAVEMIYDDASLRTRKIMQNGHLYILRDGHLFTAQGTQIK